MNWIPLAVLAALFVSSRDAWVKKYFSQLTRYDMALYPLLYALPFFLAGLLLIKWPPLDASFFSSFGAALPLEVIATLLYMESIKASPLSLTIPYLAFTPAFAILTGNLLLEEVPNAAGLLGVFITVLGSYILNFSPTQQHLLSPFAAIRKERGSYLMLCVALIYSFTSAFGKKAILHSSPLFFGFTYCVALALFMFFLLWLLGRTTPGNFAQRPFYGFIGGGLVFLELVFHNLAMATAKVAYMIAIKRLSIVFSVFYGKVLFRETNLFFRLFGAALMVSGAVVISVWGR